VPQIEVAFDIDANGIVHVSAKDLGTGKEQKITITASSGLDKGEVDRMVNDAESHAAEDKNLRDAAEVRNRADQLVYQVEKTLQESGGKVPEADQAPVRETVAEVKAALERNDVEAIKAASERLEKASHRMAEAIYRTAEGAGGAGGEQAPRPPSGDGQSGSEDVIDAEVVDADEPRRS
jgi:molecular chaperone DnaK